MRYRADMMTALLAISLCCYSCASVVSFILPEERQRPLAAGSDSDAAPGAQAAEQRARAAIVESAQALLGQKPNARVTVRDREFVLDCIGTVNAAYWGAGLDISGNPGGFQGNGVTVLYRNLEAAGGFLTDGKLPKPGDIIFWDNTWDRNGNGVIGDDPLTHAGLVIEVDDDGTIHYLHESYVSGVVIEVMNILRPTQRSDENGKILNSGMYMGSYQGNPKNPPRWMAGDLFRSLGNAGKIAERYGSAK